jgi:hypothetical protein
MYNSDCSCYFSKKEAVCPQHPNAVLCHNYCLFRLCNFVFFIPVMLPAAFVMFVTCYKIKHQIVFSSTNLYWLLHITVLHSTRFNIVTILYFRRLKEQILLSCCCHSQVVQKLLTSVLHQLKYIIQHHHLLCHNLAASMMCRMN